MTKEDYEKYWHKGGTYIIPTEVFNELFNEYEYFKQDKDNLINYLEDRYNFLLNIDNPNQISIGRRDEIKDVLERVGNNNYES